MKTELRSPAGAMQFVVLKSYDGGKHWERERHWGDFAAAAGAAQALRRQHPSIRFRVEAEPAGRLPRRP